LRHQLRAHRIADGEFPRRRVDEAQQREVAADQHIAREAAAVELEFEDRPPIAELLSPAAVLELRREHALHRADRPVGDPARVGAEDALAGERVERRAIAVRRPLRYGFVPPRTLVIVTASALFAAFRIRRRYSRRWLGIARYAR
jgi:hypothetical protein